MGIRYLNTYIESDKPFKELKDKAAEIFRSVGGSRFETPAGFQIIGGTLGTSMGIMASLTANIIMQEIKENKYEIQVHLNWGWSSQMWVLFGLGFILGGITWLIMILYLFFDPTQAYSQALYRFESFERV
jgi:hypothetical protein